MRVDNSNFHKRILISGVLIPILSLILMTIKVNYLVYLSTAVVLFALFKISQNVVNLKKNNYKQNSIDNIYTYATLILIYMFSMGIFTLLIGIVKALIQSL